ncbi:MAG: TlpA family protein disulfide reductase [Gammaproteobacteria bacterium]|nr:TlpA family protein disulfide reductase [Gammaproteobacteria bacterium]
MNFFLKTFFLISLISLISSVTVAATPGEVEAGSYLRKAKLDGLNGSSSSFTDYKGKPLIINVWASWCGPCRAEMGSLQRLADRYNGKQFNIIGVSTDDYRDRAKSFISKTDINFKNYLDSQLFLENMLGADRIPLTLLVNAEGKVLRKVSGAYEWDNPEIVEAIGKTFEIEMNINE